MPPKKKPLPLHVNRAQIEAERANVVKRTQNRIALLRANENTTQHDDDPLETTNLAARHDVQTHCCLNTLCFCVLLVIINLLFLQWLYYKVQKLNQIIYIAISIVMYK